MRSEVLLAFAMVSGAPPAAWQATDISQAAAAETRQNLCHRSVEFHVPSNPLAETAWILLLQLI
jgi:hypothetical protein